MKDWTEGNFWALMAVMAVVLLFLDSCQKLFL
jgi:hypothetical protein